MKTFEVLQIQNVNFLSFTFNMKTIKTENQNAETFWLNHKTK